MNRIVRPLLAGYYLLTLGLPALALAQGVGMPKQIVPCAGAACKCADLVTLAQNIINTGIVMVVIISALLFAYAGFLYLTNEAIGEQAKARKIFGSVAGGLIIMLAAWLVVDTLMKSVLGGSFGPWNAVAPVDDACRLMGIS